MYIDMYVYESQQGSNNKDKDIYGVTTSTTTTNHRGSTVNLVVVV